MEAQRAFLVGRKLGLQPLGSDHPFPAEGEVGGDGVDEKRLCVIGGIPSVQEEVETVSIRRSEARFPVMVFFHRFADSYQEMLNWLLCRGR